MNYKFVIVEKTIVVVFKDNVYQGTIDNISKEELALITSGDATEEQVQIIFNPVLKEVIEKKIEQEKELGELPYAFEIIDGRVCVRGINVAVPKFFVEEYKKAPSIERKQALFNFWSLACLNPDTKARDGLFDFIRASGFYITNKGYLVAYRNVKVKENGDRDLFLAICDQYVKVKKWKKSPANYYLVRYINGRLITYNTVPLDKIDADSKEYSVVGNLGNLYDNKEEYQETVYTWAMGVTGSGLETDEIRIGVPFRMQRELCDPNPYNSCSHGLHFTSWSALRDYAVGSHTLAVLVNPMHVVAVPYGYAGKKARCCEYLPVAEVKEEITSDVFDVFEQEYAEFTVEQINGMLNTTSAKDGEDIWEIEEIPSIFTRLESTLEERREKLESRYHDYSDDEDYEEDEDYEDEDEDEEYEAWRMY